MHQRRIEPGPGQESVWDYPRPPRVERADALVRVEFAGRIVAETRDALRVLETSQAPAFYLPPDDVAMELLATSSHRTTWCEWKGHADYLDLVVDEVRSPAAAWRYQAPVAGFEAITDHLSFYPARVDACFVDGEEVEAMEGDFYGGWVTSRIVGPIKGGTGTQWW